MLSFCANVAIMDTQCDGAGIRMAQEAVNANLYNMDVVPVSHIAQVYNIIKNDDLTKDQKAILTSLVIDNSAVYCCGGR